MKDRSQTIINVCLAIFVATTIYNTNELNDRIEVLELRIDSSSIAHDEEMKKIFEDYEYIPDVNLKQRREIEEQKRREK